MKNTLNFAEASLGKQKGFAPILLILLVVVLIGGGAYLYTQNSSKENVASEVKEESSSPIVKETKQITKEIVKEEQIKTYTNLKHGYSFDYDNETEIKAVDNINDPTACLSIKKGLGYILINSKAQTPCGITGVGIGMTRTVQEITVDGKKYTAGGFVSSKNQSVSSFDVNINNEISVNFGVKSGDENTSLTNDEYEKYLDGIKDILLTLKIN